MQRMAAAVVATFVVAGCAGLKEDVREIRDLIGRIRGQQPDRITLAATDCDEKCTRGASEYAWPVEFNTAGRCS